MHRALAAWLVPTRADIMNRLQYICFFAIFWLIKIAIVVLAIIFWIFLPQRTHWWFDLGIISAVIAFTFATQWLENSLGERCRLRTLK